MVRGKVDTFDIGGAAFDLTGSDLVSSSCREWQRSVAGHLSLCFPIRALF